jgi:hypothetical protein
MWSSILKPKQNELRFLVMMLCGVMLLAQACCLSPDQWAYWSLSACCSPRHAAPTGMLLPLGNLDMLLPGQNAAPFPGHTAPQACCSPWAMWVCWLPSHGMLLLLGLMLPPPLGHAARAKNINVAPISLFRHKEDFSYERCLSIWSLISSHYF